MKVMQETLYRLGTVADAQKNMNVHERSMFVNYLLGCLASEVPTDLWEGCLRNAREVYHDKMSHLSPEMANMEPEENCMGVGSYSGLAIVR